MQGSDWLQHICKMYKPSKEMSHYNNKETSHYNNQEMLHYDNKETSHHNNNQMQRSGRREKTKLP